MMSKNTSKIGKFLKNNLRQSFHSNIVGTQPAILIQKGLQQR